MFLNNQSLLEKIYFYNPWYQDKKFTFLEEEKFQKREVFFVLERYLKKRLIISLVGLRRTGKSTLMRQSINYLLRDLSPQEIFFYEFSEQDNDLEEKLDYFFQNIFKKNIYRDGCFIFLDELQYVKNWQLILKKYYDTNSNLKFIVSGSTHLYLHRNTNESLAGRIIDIRIDPLSYTEWINFTSSKKYPYLLKTENIFASSFFASIKENQDILSFSKNFKTFVSFGEFPYFFQEDNLLDLNKYYQESILERIFSYDIKLFDIDNHQAFFSLFKILNRDSGTEMNLSNIAREISINKATIKRYISILEKMFLYSQLSKYSTNLRKQLKSFKKNYISSLNLLRASLNLDYWNTDRVFWGNIVETFIFNEIKRHNFFSSNWDLFFYHDSSLKKEVDFVLSYEDKLLPIEVKTNDKIYKNYFKGILFFLEKYKQDRGILFYGGTEIKSEQFSKKEILCVPYLMV